MSAQCRHCRRQVKRVNWADGGKWTHEDSTVGRWCRTTAAAPDIDPPNAVDPATLNPPAKPYELQQGGYWDYATATDVYGNGKTWVPFKRHGVSDNG